VLSNSDAFLAESTLGLLLRRTDRLSGEAGLAGLDRGDRAELDLKRKRRGEVAFWFCRVNCGRKRGMLHLEMHLVAEHETGMKKGMAR
jgi:hypothetical protein